MYNFLPTGSWYDLCIRPLKEHEACRANIMINHFKTGINLTPTVRGRGPGPARVQTNDSHNTEGGGIVSYLLIQGTQFASYLCWIQL